MKKGILFLVSMAFLFGAVTLLADQFIQLGNPDAPKGGHLYRTMPSEPATLHPIKSTDVYASLIQNYTLDFLATRNHKTYKFQPALAHKYEITNDGKTYTFHLRKGVKYSNGKPVTAHDVKFAFEAIRNPKFGAPHLIPYYENIKSVKVIDDHTIRFQAKNTYFNNFAVVAGLSPLPRETYKDPDNSKLNKTIIGSGPYKIKEYKKGRYITLARNKDWWGYNTELYKGAYNYDEITFRFVKEENVRLEMLKKGKIHFLGLTPEQYARKTQGPLFKTKIKKQKVQNKAPKSYSFIGWNLKKPLFQDRQVRVALAHLMDREKMNKRFRYGMSLPATGPWYRQSPYAAKDVEPILFNRPKAFKMLKEAGWSDTDKDGILDKKINGKKTPFRFTLMYANRDVEKYFTLYKQDLKKSGIVMELKQIEWNSFVQALDEKKFDAVSLGWGAGSVDNDPKQIWHSDSASKGGSNFISYSNPKVDQLIEKGRMTMDRDKRIETYKEIYREIAKDAPYAFMFVNKYDLYAHSKKLAYKKPTFAYDLGLEYWWMKQ